MKQHNSAMDELKLNTKDVGDLGEKIALQYLLKKGFTCIETNYRKKWGEIDVIVKKDDVVHFVEVKSVSYETRDELNHSVTHETWQPEELVHKFKIHQIEKALETWISDHKYIGEWVIDVAVVRIVPRETFATVKFLEKIVPDYR